MSAIFGLLNMFMPICPKTLPDRHRHPAAASNTTRVRFIVLSFGTFEVKFA
jgi:hypothetical protein